MSADDRRILDQLELGLRFYPSLLVKEYLSFCVEAELIQAKEGISLPEIIHGGGGQKGGGK